MPHVAPATSEIIKPVLSPFRYPGGKSWLRPIILQWLKHSVEHLVEPFAGGGNITLAALSSKLVKRATMIELDPSVSAVWQVVLDGDANWLSKQIKTFKLTKTSVAAELKKDRATVRQKAWLTLLRNRVSHGGILAPGSGLLKLGENGKGLKSRWYPETLSERILEIQQLKKQITFIEGDGLDWLQTTGKNLKPDSVAFFIDPPYTTAGQRLYEFFQIDHANLFRIASELPGKVLMSYEDSTEIRKLADQYRFWVRTVEMRSRQHITKTELLISNDFAWYEI